MVAFQKGPTTIKAECRLIVGNLLLRAPQRTTSFRIDEAFCNTYLERVVAHISAIFVSYISGARFSHANDNMWYSFDEAVGMKYTRVTSATSRHREFTTGSNVCLGLLYDAPFAGKIVDSFDRAHHQWIAIMVDG